MLKCLSCSLLCPQIRKRAYTSRLSQLLTELNIFVVNAIFESRKSVSRFKIREVGLSIFLFLSLFAYLSSYHEKAIIAL